MHHVNSNPSYDKGIEASLGPLFTSNDPRISYYTDLNPLAFGNGQNVACVQISSHNVDMPVTDL